MSELSIFKNNALANSDLFKSLQGLNDNLAGGGAGGTNRRISIKGSKFREIVNGEQVNVSKDDSINIVIVDAAPVSRTYYEGEYDSTKVVPPTCWSKDTQTPAREVPQDQRQSAKCIDCPMNVKGSGQGESRACRFSQRIAVVLANDIEGDVLQLTLPAQSIFGKEEGDNRPLQAYSRWLIAQSIGPDMVVTRMRFDTKAESPKLFFKPMRWLTDDEHEVCARQGKTPEATKAITMTVAQTDKVAEKPISMPGTPPAAAKPKAKPKATPFAGATPWPCRWTAACGTWTLTIGCT